MNYKNVVFDIVGVLFEYRLFSGQKFIPIDAGIRLLQQAYQKNVVQIFACTNMSSNKFTLLKKEYPEIIACFTGVVTSQEAGAAKPDKQIFRYLCQIYSLDPQEIIYLDDAQENVLATQQMGMRSILVNDFNDVRGRLEKLGVI